MNSVAIIGAGQLGSRHLQALKGLELELFVVDPSAEALATCGQRWNEVNIKSSCTVHYLDEIDKLPNILDIVIVATGSNVRRKVIEQIVSHSTFKFLILEKFLFQEEADYHFVNALLKQKDISAWVNCPRRVLPAYIELKHRLKGPLTMNVVGSNWGLACNCIHWVDLFCWLTDELPDKVYSLFYEGFVKAKRSGYIEINGSLLVQSKGKNVISIHCLPEGDHPLIVTINCSDESFIIYEGFQKMLYSSKSTDWNLSEQPFKTLKQSELTDIVVADLLTKKKCELPTYAYSMELHLPLLRAFLNHYNCSLQTSENTLCPIT